MVKRSNEDIETAKADTEVMQNKKEFGKITVEHLQQILALLPFLDQARPELAQLILEKPEKASKLFKNGLSWCQFYELPFASHLRVFSEIAGLNEFINSAVASVDPYSEMMKLDGDPDYQNWNGGTNQKYEIHHLLGVLYSLMGTLDSLMLYGFYINELLEKATEQDDDGACQFFCVKRGHEIIPKGMFHDRRNDYQEA